MASKGVTAPRLPAAPVEYDQRFMDALLSILRQYFNSLDNPGPIVVSTQRQPATGTTPALIVSALSGATPKEPDRCEKLVFVPAVKYRVFYCVATCSI